MIGEPPRDQSGQPADNLMSKRKHKRQTAELFSTITQRTNAADRDESDTDGYAEQGHDHSPLSDDVLARSKELSPLLAPEKQARDLPKMKKFRFQLLHQWIVTELAPCRMADVGGGKGLLAYLFQQSGWAATVIDPIQQSLPDKYKDIATAKQVRIPPTASVPRIDSPFTPAMADNFDLLVAMHAHGCNIQLIDAAAHYGRSVILLPCCIIQEPIIPPPNVHWIQCVVDYALHQGFNVKAFRLNFKGQSIGLYLQPTHQSQQ